MQKTGAVVYWFCSGVALLLALFGVGNALITKQGRPILILLYCLMVAAAFFLAGAWTRRMARRAASDGPPA